MSNANIILSGRTVGIDRAKNRAAGTAARAAQTLDMVNQVNLISGLTNLQRETATRNALRGIDPTSSDYYSQAATAVAPHSPTTARSLYEQGTAYKDKLMDSAIKKRQLVGQFFASANTPETYQQGIDELAGMGLDVSRFPQWESPEQMQRLARATMSVEQQSMAANRDRSYKLSREQFDETKRKNVADERHKRLTRLETIAKNTRDSEGKTQENIFKLQKEWKSDQEVKAFREVSRATKNLMTALKTAPISAPATLGAATAFMKLLDPGSVVRESELGAALAAQGLLGRLESLWKVTDKGRVMSQTQAEEFQALSRDIYTAAAGRYAEVEDYYEDFAVRIGVDPVGLFIDPTIGGDILNAEIGGGSPAPVTPDTNPERFVIEDPEAPRASGGRNRGR